MRLCLLLLSSLLFFCASAVQLDAATAAEILTDAKKHMTEDAWVDLGSSAWAEAIKKSWSVNQDITGEELVTLRLALVEAWLAAGQLEAAQEQMDAVATVVAEDKPNELLMERYGNAIILAWTLMWRNAEKDQKIDSAGKALKKAGSFSNTIKARAHVAEAARLIAIDKAKKSLVQYDAAYALLKAASLDERITILQLRLTAMETAGMRQAAIADWFERRKNDEAIKAMSGELFSEAQSLIGKQLAVPKLYADYEEEVDGDVVTVKGQQCAARLVFVFATWSKGSAESAPILAKIQAEFRGAVDVVGVSIDTEESVKDIPLFLQKFALDIPVFKERKAWESEMIKQLHIDAIPTIMLIDQKGVLHASDMHGIDAAETEKRLRDSVQQLLNGGVPVEAEPAVEPGEAEDFP